MLETSFMRHVTFRLVPTVCVFYPRLISPHVFACCYVAPPRSLGHPCDQHEKVLAVFPDTTIFYCATVAKDTPRMEGNSKVSCDDSAAGKCG